MALKSGQYWLTDILWYTQKESVLNEIASIMGLDSADTNTPKWFEHQTRASKNVSDALSEEERKTLEEEAEQMWQEGLSVDRQ